MPIEFRCPSCNQQLRVPDTAGGKNAKCPKCSTVLAVPASTSAASPPAPLGPPPQPQFNFGGAAANPAPNPPPLKPVGAAPQGAFGPPPNSTSFPAAGGGGSFGAPPPSSPFGPPPSPFGDAQSGANPFALKPADTATVNPYASPTGGYQVNQMSMGGVLGHQEVEVGTVLNYAIKVWQNNLGMLIAITLLPALVVLPILALVWGGMFVAAAADAPELFIVVILLAIPITMVINVYLGIGQTQMILKICRGQPTTLGELFAGGEKFFVTLGWTFLATIGLMIGFMLLYIPGIIMMFFFWPAHFLVVDGKGGAIDSFEKAYNITKGNHMTTFLLALCAMGFSTLGAISCYVGLIFAVPLISVMWATAYLMMSGQIPVPQRTYVPQQPMYR